MYYFFYFKCCSTVKIVHYWVKMVYCYFHSLICLKLSKNSTRSRSFNWGWMNFFSPWEVKNEQWRRRIPRRFHWKTSRQHDGSQPRRGKSIHVRETADHRLTSDHGKKQWDYRFPSRFDIIKEKLAFFICFNSILRYSMLVLLSLGIILVKTLISLSLSFTLQYFCWILFMSLLPIIILEMPLKFSDSRSWLRNRRFFVFVQFYFSYNAGSQEGAGTRESHLVY